MRPIDQIDAINSSLYSLHRKSDLSCDLAIKLKLDPFDQFVSLIRTLNYSIECLFELVSSGRSSAGRSVV